MRYFSRIRQMRYFALSIYGKLEAVSPNRGDYMELKNKAAMLLQCKSNDQLIAASRFIPFSCPI